MLGKRGVWELILFVLTEGLVLGLHCLFWDEWADK